MEQVRVVIGEKSSITHVSQDGTVASFVVAQCLCYYLFRHDYRVGLFFSSFAKHGSILVFSSRIGWYSVKWFMDFEAKKQVLLMFGPCSHLAQGLARSKHAISIQ